MLRLWSFRSPLVLRSSLIDAAITRRAPLQPHILFTASSRAGYAEVPVKKDPWSEDGDSPNAEAVEAIERSAPAGTQADPTTAGTDHFAVFGKGQIENSSKPSYVVPTIKHWTKEEIAKLLDLRCQKVPHKQIARILNRPETSVQKMYSLVSGSSHLVKRAWTPEEHQKAATMRSQGIRRTEVARALNRPCNSIRSVETHSRLANHIWRGARHFSPEDNDKIVQLRHKGLTWHDVHAALPQWDAQTLRLHAAQLGLQPRRKPSPLWTEAELSVLRKLREQEQLGWTEIARQLAPRTAVAARKRYTVLQNPKVGPYSRAEVETIFLMRASGSRWTEIAARLNRREHKVSNHFRETLRYKASVLPDGTVQWHTDPPST